ncbi:hypothetical protein A0H81_05965 [Grifola frondosa]|uniref:Uncharacterized protein n=1 Tax=Grifola frondosa TaxID=5627 RepID=A0A1C7M9Y4_GRIFR|nr:hypothetical protein A0H81_05965 [Grifola frondosa]
MAVRRIRWFSTWVTFMETLRNLGVVVLNILKEQFLAGSQASIFQHGLRARKWHDQNWSDRLLLWRDIENYT